MCYGVEPLFKNVFFSIMFVVLSYNVANAGQTEIICRIKGSGQKVFVLDGGFWSSSVLFKNSLGEFQEWCPETDEQNLKLGKNLAICKFSGARLRNRLVWGETTIDFSKPSWNKRYRHAKLGHTWKESQPGGRETAVCKHK
jgi:hypothetical protein